MKDFLLYAIYDKDKDKLVSDATSKRHKFYEIKSFRDEALRKAINYPWETRNLKPVTLKVTLLKEGEK